MTNYSPLELEQVLYIHDRIIEAAGGKEGIRDFTLLHSALERCKVTFGGEDLYPTMLDKAAALAHSMIMNHPFLDANKRTGYAIMSRFLNANGVRVTATQPQIIDFCLAVDNKGWKVREIVGWLKKNTKRDVRNEK